MAHMGGKPLDIDKYLKLIENKGYGKGGARNRIYRIGVELEGGWKKLPEGCNLVHDGSVVLPEAKGDKALYALLVQCQRNSDNARTDAELSKARKEYAKTDVAYRASMLQTGEIPSDIMELEKVTPWMKKYYPTHVNASCGLHVHMSFMKAFYYQRLMIPHYPMTIVHYMAQWAKNEGLSKEHCIWERLFGNSEFCQPLFEPDKQARRVKKEYDRHQDGNRYTMINYCYGTHGTIECRLLPMMDDPGVGIRAVHRIIDITNACLISRVREEQLSSDVVIDPNDAVFREERVERI